MHQNCSLQTILECTRNVRTIFSNLSVPGLFIQTILGRTRIVRECFNTGRLNDADCQVLCRNAPGSSGRNEYK